MDEPLQKHLEIPSGWIVAWHHFREIEPDNDQPIEDVKKYFKENLLFAIKSSYYVSIGFIGDYMIDRSGFFLLEVMEGEPTANILFERSITRSTNDVKRRFEWYMTQIENDQLQSSQGIPLDLKENILFSSIDQSKEVMEENFFKLVQKRKR